MPWIVKPGHASQCTHGARGGAGLQGGCGAVRSREKLPASDHPESNPPLSPKVITHRTENARGAAVMRGSTVAEIAACAMPERVDLRARRVEVRDRTP
jgi:hypothetical protein